MYLGMGCFVVLSGFFLLKELKQMHMSLNSQNKTKEVIKVD